MAQTSGLSAWGKQCETGSGHSENGWAFLVASRSCESRGNEVYTHEVKGQCPAQFPRLLSVACM